MNLSEVADLQEEFVLVAGPNGSGKTTIADDYIKSRFPIWPKLNADEIALALRDEPALLTKPLEEEPLVRQAANIIDIPARGLILLREPLVLETVLASHKYRPLLPAARRAGLIFRLVYITTTDPEINVSRVAGRVARGGHDVPDDKIRKRWGESMDNLPWFAARADRLVVADNSGDHLRVVALRKRGGGLELLADDHPCSDRLRDLVGTPVVTTY